MATRIAIISSLLFATAACSGDDSMMVDSGPGTDGGVDSGPGDTGLVDTGADDSGMLLPDTGSVMDAAPDTAVDSATPPADGAIFACNLEELTPVFECARDRCLELPDASLPGLPDVGLVDGGIPDTSLPGLPDASLPDPGELAACIVLNCGIHIFGVSGGCRGCLLAGVGMDLEEIGRACAPGIPLP